MSIIEVNQLEKVYQSDEIRVQAINGIDVCFSKGEFTAIVGPSGSGKTTFLNLLGGLDKATKGTILVDGTDISSLSDSKLIDFRLHHIGFVFQSYNLIPVLTARENVEFIMYLQGISSRDREKRSRELLEAVGLADRADVRPSRLSGGQQQRIAVARALASRPSFVLADEPTANLDSKSASTLLEIMEKLNYDEQVTFLFSTHDARVVKKARRVITIEDGKILSDATR